MQHKSKDLLAIKNDFKTIFFVEFIFMVTPASSLLAFVAEENNYRCVHWLLSEIERERNNYEYRGENEKSMRSFKILKVFPRNECLDFQFISCVSYQCQFQLMLFCLSTFWTMLVTVIKLCCFLEPTLTFEIMNSHQKFIFLIKYMQWRTTASLFSFRLNDIIETIWWRDVGNQMVVAFLLQPFVVCCWLVHETFSEFIDFKLRARARAGVRSRVCSCPFTLKAWSNTDW